MKTFIHTISAILFVAFIAGCSVLGADDKGDLLDDSFFETATTLETSTVANSFVTIEQSQFASYKFSEKTNEIINDSQSFETLWEDIHANTTPLPELPEIDFTEYTVIASMMGVQNSGGYSIEISEIAASDDIIGVKIEEREPGSDCVTTGALTSPFHIVKVPKSPDGDVRFTTDRTVFECGSD